MKRDNKIVVDLAKVQHARFGYRNQYGQWSDTKMENSVRGIPFCPDEISIIPHMTMLDLAILRGIIDIYTPVVILKLTANESLEYSGERAVNIYKEWCGRIFNKKKGTR